MATRERIEQLVKSAYAARAAKNIDEILGVFTPDATFRLAGSPAAFAGARVAKGTAALRESIGMLVETFDFLERTMLTSIIEGNKAAVHWRVQMRHNPTGEIFETELFDLWIMDGDSVASFVQFCDTALLVKLMGPG